MLSVDQVLQKPAMIIYEAIYIAENNKQNLQSLECTYFIQGLSRQSMWIKLNLKSGVGRKWGQKKSQGPDNIESYRLNIFIKD